ncbi:DUF6916 family protein [Thalassospira mesophila]|uniref:DUF6916 domain-containing protein n=1 Tax=Thalassospira mesophila TaxID=1293891 RepID=A0A1Y2L4Y7_9PROT|nr:hypothetical protein [Thalassospira mesophila]OSQ40872.1 hypothetical protein TMES_04270 [Thalassospira mesophila]
MTETTTPGPLSLAKITAEIFIPRLESTFIFSAQSHSLPVTLVECRENPDGAGPDSTRTPFTLVFHASTKQENPILNVKDLIADMHGLEQGSVDTVSIQRILRPPRLPAGAYFQIVFG